MNSGSCMCGQVRFEAAGTLRKVIFCHCSQCRKSSGHFFAATAVQKESLTVSGDVSWFQSSEDAKRGFCAICGSSLFFDAGHNHMSVLAGAFDGQPDFGAAGHIFCSDKGSYYEIEDGLPQADGYDPAITAAAW